MRLSGAGASLTGEKQMTPAEKRSWQGYHKNAASAIRTTDGPPKRRSPMPKRWGERIGKSGTLYSGELIVLPLPLPLPWHHVTERAPLACKVTIQVSTGAILAGGRPKSAIDRQAMGSREGAGI